MPTYRTDYITSATGGMLARMRHEGMVRWLNGHCIAALGLAEAPIDVEDMPCKTLRPLPPLI